MMTRRNDSIMSYVNRQEERRAGASTCSKKTTFFQMLLTTAGLSIATVLVFHSLMI